MLEKTSFIRCKVNHKSFVTGISGYQDGININVILHAHMHEGHSADPSTKEIIVDKNFNVLRGGLMQCLDLLTYFCGTYDDNALRNVDNLKNLSEFEIENWVFDRIWKLTSKTKYFGVKVINAFHGSDGGTRMCEGIITFIYEDKKTEDIINGEEIIADNFINLRKVLLDKIDGPKHCSNYLG